MHAPGERAVLRAALDNLKTLALFVALAAVAAGVGYLVLGTTGLVLGALAVGMLASAGASVPSAVVMRMQGAVSLHPGQAPTLFRLVGRLAQRANIPPPALYWMPSDEANAMAVGSAARGGALAVTEGALRMLSRDELEGVLAHEVAHLKNGDTATLRLAALVSNAVVSVLRFATWVAVFGLLLTGAGLARVTALALLGMVVPALVTWLRAALARSRELAADATAAALTGRPHALARALAKLERQPANWIAQVFGGRRLPAWLRSHPATDERIQRLLALAG